MKKPYPIRGGLPVPSYELPLPRTHLDPYNHKSYQNHHRHFFSGWYRSNVILNCLRDLEGNQDRVFKDQHVLGKFAIHNYYDPPPVPLIKTAMERLEEGYETNERFKVWNDPAHTYLHHEFTDEIWDRLQQVYNCYE